MAPIFSTEVGITPQIIDDARLLQLRRSLAEIELWLELGKKYSKTDEVEEPIDINHLISLIEPWQSWRFEEQVDLHEWTRPLNRIDACLSYYIQKYPAILLIGPVKRTRSRGSASTSDQLISKPAESLEEVNSVPDESLKNVRIILNFLSGLMANSSNKAVFNSVEEMVDLLAAADDSIATNALRVLCNLATPPALHKQQAPEIQQHTSALHSSRTSSHKRLIAMARGWGTRGSGLGLYTCATADDSEFGQGALPQDAGELHFACYKQARPSKQKKSETDDDDFEMLELILLKKDIVDDSVMALETGKGSDNNDESSQKRRRVAPMMLGERALRSTPDLFFDCLNQAGGRDQIPDDKIFMLLADIRLAKSFHCLTTRVAALERRLLAIITILHSHPSQEIMSGYFQAQPELCVELIDLLRATVSSASVSAASSKAAFQGIASSRNDSMAALADPTLVPYQLRELALQALTALVGRRDGTTGALTGVARHSNVLNELGVGKGQYLGLLPTLIRFSLASLASLVSTEGNKGRNSIESQQTEEDAIAFDIGLAFVQGSMPAPLPRHEQLLKALEFIDSVLTLTSAVVSTQSGTSALTECGLIPAMLTTVSVNHEEIFEKSELAFPTSDDAGRIRALLRFVTAQAVQIIEGAIVTQSNALTAFHDLNGVEVLTTRLSKEIEGAAAFSTSDDAMDTDDNGRIARDASTESTSIGQLRCSQRVILFSIVTCLTVVFHQESTSSSTTAPSGATELRKPGLTNSLIRILNNMNTFGGHLGSLIATLLADVMNSDPHVVRHVHSSGLAESFLNFFPTDVEVPGLPPVPELIMAVPNVLSALALTEDGARIVKDANPFHALLKIFYHPKYAMPKSKCLLNELTAIVGTGLDEIMRHITSLKPQICSAIADAMNTVADLGEALATKEKDVDGISLVREGQPTDLENERSCLMQYALNFGQLLEQILHNEEHTTPFVSAGGLDALLRLYPCLMPTGREFLSHVSCLSCPSVSTLSHSSTEDALTLAFRCITLRYDPFELVKTLISNVSTHMSRLEELQMALRRVMPSEYNVEAGADATFVLQGLPYDTLYALLAESSRPREIRDNLSDYLRQVVAVQWVTGLLAAAIKAACQRSQDMGTGWSRQEREWKKELSSTTFEELTGRLSKFHQTSIFEACRVRTEEGFEERERSRRQSKNCRTLRYRLRIVCPEGAVVRDGIEIDSCASVGNMEMGEIAIAFDRCVNSSGVMRYRTARGWVSEQTRGHGREPIAEVLSVWESDDDTFAALDLATSKERIEAGLADVRTTGANVLSRLQASYSELYSALSKVVMQSARSIPVRSISFQEGTIGAHVATIVRFVKTGIRDSLNMNGIGMRIRSNDSTTSTYDSGISMYLGCILSHLQACLFEEKRDRRTVNAPLLIGLSGIWGDGSVAVHDAEHATIFDAMSFIFQQALFDFEMRRKEATMHDSAGNLLARRLQSRTTAASLPAALSVLKRCISGPAITSSPISSVLSRVKISDLTLLLGEGSRPEAYAASSSSQDTFSPERFFRELLCKVSAVLYDVWTNGKLVYAPPYVAHPIATSVSETMAALEDSMKTINSTRTTRESGLWNAFRGLVANRAEDASTSNSDQDFEPSEEAVNRLMEMGFSRDHAWVAIDSTRSNQLEVAMEYALSHAPPSSDEVERRRNAADTRRRDREERNQAASDHNAESAEEPSIENNEVNSSSESVDVDRNQDESDGGRPLDDSVESIKACLEKWKSGVSDVSCSILSGLKSFGNSRDENSPGRLSPLTDGDGDIEALTVVLTSFLIDVSQRYPDQRDQVADTLFEALDSQLDMRELDGKTYYEVAVGCESSFSAFCHAAVLFSRALPKTRTIILKYCLVRKIVCCIGRWVSSSIENKAGFEPPVGFAAALLLLDVMAQPIVAFKDVEKDNEKSPPSTENELELVEHEHRKQAGNLSDLARDLFVALNAEKKSSKNHTDSISHNAKPEDSKAEALCNDSAEASNDLLFKAVPAYFPLLPIGTSQKCADICLRILEGSCKSRGIIHGALLLLLRLLRSPATSSYCAKGGLAEKILALPYQCRFTGHSGLVTLIVRRMLEDENTLQHAMETEIRQTISKIHGRSQSSASSDNGISVPRKSFVQAVTPLLCREPSCFLKAVSVSVHFENGESDDSTSGQVTLLGPQEKTRRARLLSDLGKTKTPADPGKTIPTRRSSIGRTKRSTSSPRSKTPVRSNKRGVAPKRSKKERAESKERSDDETKVPVNVITGQLINHLVKECDDLSSSKQLGDKNKNDFGNGTTFLWAADILTILSELVLAIPACATSIHKFRPSKCRSPRAMGLLSIQHALKGCQVPNKTFVNFLLHSLLVQDRSGLQLCDDEEDEDEKKTKKELALCRTKVSQASARLLFALVARPGEGRRRVIAELAFALSGGLLGLSCPSPPQQSNPEFGKPRASDIHALQAWGELCIGLAAPRNSGGNFEGNNSLSFEVIRIMLESGIAHALLAAVHRVPLNHPRAPSAVAAIVLPFEVMSRPSVADAVKAMVEREIASKEEKGNAKSLKSSSADSGKERTDSFGDDQMLEDAFAVQESQDSGINRTGIEENYDDTDDLQGPQDDRVHQDFIIADGGPHMEEIDIEDSHMDIDDEMEGGDASEDEISSSEENDSSEGDDAESDDDDDDDDDDNDGGDESDSESIIDDDEPQPDGDGEGGHGFRDDMLVENPDLELQDDAPIPEDGDRPDEEGWTRVESNGLGGMVLGGRRGLGQNLGGGVSARTRGFIDAAEAMIGTLLRTGEIHGDALAEIEGSLGIRIMHQGGPSRGAGRQPALIHGSMPASFGASGGGARGEVGPGRAGAGLIGTLPQINQRTQPDIGYSTLADGRRWNISSMEYVYGGPSLNAGSRNYDLVARPLDTSQGAAPSPLSQADTPLFPGGPSTVTHARIQHSLHPLLCGVDLPPINALVSDLMPHGVRENRRGQVNGRTQGEWTSSSLPGGGFLLSTSNGHIIRSNRSPGGVSLSMGSQPASVAGPVGWTDEGLPFDGTVEEFSSAFDRALGEAMNTQSAENQEITSSGPRSSTTQNNESTARNEEVASSDTAMADASQDTSASASDERAIGAPDSSDGDGVATSLAAGLRLSPTGGSSHQPSEIAGGTHSCGSSAGNTNTHSPDDDGNSGHNEEVVATNEGSGQSQRMEEQQEDGGPASSSTSNELVCPPDVDPEVFIALPPEMQREVVDQARAAADVASQLGAGSSLDPEVLASLPDDVREDVLAQEQRERRTQEQAPADPANAEEMDNASFVASLSPELREDILLTSDDTFIQSLPENLRAEAQVLRERASINRRGYEEPAVGTAGATLSNEDDPGHRSVNNRDAADSGVSNVSRRKQRCCGKMRVESDRENLANAVTDKPTRLSPLVAKSDIEAFFRLMYLLSPVRPQRLIHKIFHNMSSVPKLRRVLTSVLIRFLHDDYHGARVATKTLEKEYTDKDDWRSIIDRLFGNDSEFPPRFLIGTAPEVLETDSSNPNLSMIRRKQNSDTAASMAANLPMAARGSRHESFLPPVVANRILDTLQNICKNSPRFSINLLVDGLVEDDEMVDMQSTGFDKLLDLLDKPRYTKSSVNLEQLLVLLESAVAPLSSLPKHGEEEAEISQKDIDAAASAGKEWVDVPRIIVSQERLQFLCSILRMETCRDASFAKVNTIARRLCRVDANRGYVLAELASVARALGADAIRDLKALGLQLSNAAELKAGSGNESMEMMDQEGMGLGSDSTRSASATPGSASSSVAVSSSTSELKLLRVLQTLQALCTDVADDNPAKKDGTIYVTNELVHLFRAMELDDLWVELSSCLKIVQVLEGVKIEEDNDTSRDDENDGDEDNIEGGEKLQNSVAGLLTRFLPSIESFFVANASAIRVPEKGKNEEGGTEKNEHEHYNLIGGDRLVDFVTTNKVLLNALVRNNSSLLDKGLKALVHVPQCRHLLDFDVKRHWFKSQVRRLRQHANRRHGTLRLQIDRRNVLIDAYHQLRVRNAEEMRGRLHITFRDEQGVDAGGLSREFFGILAKEIFNPNYALFTSTEDGSTFQPNPNSSINPDHLSYFRFVGRIVGKAVLDGYLLDAHFTRSLYKHMLGIKPTHHDMEAIDPDYYKNLKTILEYNLGDLGLDLTFSIEDHSFGRSRMIDLIDNGRNEPVTEENKGKYVRLVCQHRMTTAILSQINAYLDGFYELVSRDLITIFTPRELELLISGLPDIDVNDLKQNTDYVGWKASDEQIQWFWNVLFSLSRNEKAAFLQFVTGSSKVPLAGFGELPGMRGVQKFSVHKASGSAGALMSAHTCFNSLDLPVYNNEEEMKEKLLYAINEGVGAFSLA